MSAAVQACGCEFTYTRRSCCNQVRGLDEWHSHGTGRAVNLWLIKASSWECVQICVGARARKVEAQGDFRVKGWKNIKEQPPPHIYIHAILVYMMSCLLFVLLSCPKRCPSKAKSAGVHGDCRRCSGPDWSPRNLPTFHIESGHAETMPAGLGVHCRSAVGCGGHSFLAVAGTEVESLAPGAGPALDPALR